MKPCKRPSSLVLASCTFLLIAWLTATAVLYAHAELVSASPEPGAVVNNPLTEIQLTFSEPILIASEIVLFDANFQTMPAVTKKFSTTEPTILRATVPDLAPGTYTVQYTAVSDDGHEIGGSYAFQVGATGLTLSNPQRWIFGLSILLIIGIVVIWRRNHKQAPINR